MEDTTETTVTPIKAKRKIEFEVYEGKRRKAHDGRFKRQFYSRIVEANYAKGWQTEGYDSLHDAFAACDRLWWSFARQLGADELSPTPYMERSLRPDGSKAS